MKKEADFEENKPLNFDLTPVTHQQNQSFTLSLKKSTADTARCVTEFKKQCYQLLSSDVKKEAFVSFHLILYMYYKGNLMPPAPSFSL